MAPFAVGRGVARPDKAARFAILIRLWLRGPDQHAQMAALEAALRSLKTLAARFRYSPNKPFCIAFSLAGLLLTRVWQDVDHLTTPLATYRFGPALPRTVEAVSLAGVFLFTVVFWLLIFAATQLRNPRLRGAAVRALAIAGGIAVCNLVLLAAEKATQHILDTRWLQSHTAAWTAFLWASRVVRWALIPGALVAAAMWFPKRTWAALQVIATVMIPFAAWRTGDAFYHLVRPRRPAVLAKKPPQVNLKARLPWIVWVVFDEMDQFATFDDPANSALTPALHAFRHTAFYATRAYEPSDNTAKSIPAYLTGRLPIGQRWDRTGLQLRFSGSDRYVAWWRERTILDEATEAGHTLAVLGYFHPYCELFGKATSACAEFPACGVADLDAWATSTEGASLRRTARLELIRLLPLPPTETRYDGRRFRYSDWILRNHARQVQSRCLGEVSTTLLGWLRDSKASFYFLHLPLPHPPAVVSCPQLRCDHKVQPGYAGNLHWSDHLFDEIRRELLRQGRWESTTVVVTSDHTARRLWVSSTLLTPSLERAMQLHKQPTVPMMIKLPGQREGLAYSRPFNAVLLHGIVRGILWSRLKSPQDVAAYLDANRGRVPLNPHRTTS